MSEQFPERPHGDGARRIQKYEILGEIGAGGMSRVYRARNVETGEIVAIKVIKIENMAEDFRLRLEREPEVQRGVGHENIVRLMESFRERDEFFLVMEYVDGRSLSQMIHGETGPMTLERARKYFRGVLRAVEHLHRLGIIHRDIKPSNILIGWDDTVKLADFGIAKFTWQHAQTKTQRGLGTPEYMSPEQARGSVLDQRTDIYSLGITFFETLTGRKPFSRSEDTPVAYGEVIQEILSRPLPDPRTFIPSISPEVVRLLNKATRKDPGERFQSASEFLGAMEIIEEGTFYSGQARSPIIDSTPTMVAPAGTPAAGMRSDTRSGAGGGRYGDPVPTMAVGAGGGARAEAGADRGAFIPRPAPPEPPAGRSMLPWVLLVLLVLGVGGYFGYQWYQNQQGATPGTAGTLSDADAMRIAETVAAETRKYQIAANAPALAALFAPSGVEFFKLKRATRAAIQKDLTSFLGRIVRTDKFDVDVRRATPLNDSTVEAEWIIEYERMRDDGTLLRGSTSNITRLRQSSGEWLIISQTERWTDRDNVAPQKPDTPSVVDTVPLEDNSAENPRVPQNAATARETAHSFISMILAGDADQAWNLYATQALRESSDRGRFTGDFSGKGFELIDIVPEGDVIVARIARSDGGIQSIYRIYFRIADEGGAKISSIRINSR